MKALVVYDSYFGNTEKVAQAIGEALCSPEEVEVRKVNEVASEELTEVDVLVVGSPTRAFKATPAIYDLIKGVPRGGLQGTKVAAFDTRISEEDAGSKVFSFFVKFFGWAAEPIAKRLQKKGGKLAAPPAGFLVEGSEGPLKEGELERARAWAQKIIGAR